MSNKKSLQHIFAELPLPFCMRNVPDIPVSGISIDSRAVNPGHLFVALKGGNVDGHDYIQKAIDNGAVAVVGEVGRTLAPAASAGVASVTTLPCNDTTNHYSSHIPIVPTNPQRPL